MRKGRILAAILTLGLALGEPGAVQCGYAFAATQESVGKLQADFLFDEVTGCLTFYGEGAISAKEEDIYKEGGMKYYDAGEWKKTINPSAVKSVVIRDGVTEIGSGVFSYMNAEKVTIAGSVQKIGAGAFGGCKNLKEVIIGDGNVNEPMEIEEAAFGDCEKLSRITFGNNVGILGERFLGMAPSLEQMILSPENPYFTLKDGMLYSEDGTELYLCTRTKAEKLLIAAGTRVVKQLAVAGVPVKRVSLPASTEVLEAGAFQGCTELEKVTFANGSARVRTEEYYHCFGDEVEEWYTTFGGCTALQSISFADRLEVLSENTFMNCSSLTKLALGRNFKGFTEQSGQKNTTALKQKGMRSLKKVTVAKKNKVFCSVNGVLYTKAKDMLCMYPAGRAAKTYKVADSVTVIGKNAFANNKRLTKLVLGRQTRRIEAYAFCNNTALTSLDMGAKLTGIAKGAFEGCVKLSDVKWSKKLYNVGDYAFWRCRSLKRIVFDKNRAAAVGRGAFQACRSVKTVVWPKRFTRLGTFAFYGCKKLRFNCNKSVI